MLLGGAVLVNAYLLGDFQRGDLLDTKTGAVVFLSYLVECN